MAFTVKIYDAEFKRQMAALAKTLRENDAEFSPARMLNAEAFHLAKEAMDITRRARRNSIEALGLHTTEKKAYTTSKGFTRFKRKFSFDRPVAVTNYVSALIHNKGGKAASDYLRSKIASRHAAKQFAKQAKGKKSAQLTQGAADNELGQMARQWIAKKLRSIGFLASTWKLVVRKFDRYAKDKGGANGGEVFGGKLNSVVSNSKVATGRDLTAVLSLQVGSDKYGNHLRDYAVKLMRDALQLAIISRTEKIKRRIGYVMDEAMKKSGINV